MIAKKILKLCLYDSLLFKGVSMRFKGIYINNDFLSVFTPKELETILPCGIILKDTFLQLLEESPIQYPQVVEVEM